MGPDHIFEPGCTSHRLLATPRISCSCVSSSSLIQSTVATEAGSLGHTDYQQGVGQVETMKVSQHA